MPNATLSRDGKYRINLQITFRASIGDLANALAYEYRNHSIDSDGQLPKLSKAATREKIRDAFHRTGVSIDGWGDNFGMTETTERLEWATDLVRNAYPELAEGELGASVASASEANDESQHLSCHTHPSVQLDPAVTDIPACPRTHGNTEYGVFGDEGSLEVYDCAISAANRAAEFAAEDPDTDYTVREVCPEHRDEAHATCPQCSSDEPEEAEEHKARCTECKGAGCHWCYWTGKKDA